MVERQPEAEALIHYTFEARKQANAPVADIPQNQRVRVYMANPDLNTYGAGKYTGLMMAHAGALNVAAASVKAPAGVAGAGAGVESTGDLRPGPLSAGGQTDRERPAVAGDRCGETSPRVADAGVCQSRGYPMPEALALGELWMAKNSILRATRASMWTVKPGIIISVFTAWRGCQMPANSQPWLVQEAGAGDAGDRGRLALFRPVPVKPERRWPHHGPSAAGRRGDRADRLVGSPAARGDGPAGRGALGLCGATLQGVFQNPLVDPHIIGVTAGSAFGGTLAILLGVGSLLMMASTFSSASSRWG